MRKSYTRFGFGSVMYNRFAALVKTSFARHAGVIKLVTLVLSVSIPSAGVLGNATVEPVAVETTKPQKVTLKRTTTQPGTVCAFFEAELYARVGGYVKKLYVDMGDQVEEGQKLAEIDVPDLLKAYERQEAEVMRLQSEKGRCDAAIEVAKAKVELGQAGVMEAEARVAADRSEHQRIEQLVESGAVTQRLRDETLSRLQASEAALSSQKANLNVAQAELRMAQATAQAAQAAGKVGEKQLEELGISIGYATLRAPFKGVVTQRAVDPGDLIQSAQSSSRGEKKALFTIAQIDKVRVQVPIPQRDAALADVGDKAQFTYEALRGKALEGTISRLSKSLDRITRTMMVEVDFPNADGRLLPGLFGQMTIVLEERTDRLVLPAACIHNEENGGECHVYVVDSSDKVQQVPVTTGFDDGRQIEVTAGLNGNERVVTGMLSRLSPNQTVKVLR